MIPKPFTAEEKYIITLLDTPEKISRYLIQNMDYDMQDDNPAHRMTNRSFRRIVNDKKAHCLEGVFFAATIMREHGYTPYMVALEAYRDHSHNIMVYRDKNNAKVGSLALSRDKNLWERKPVHPNLHELALSYYLVYTEYVKDLDYPKKHEMNDAIITMRGYSELINLDDYLKKGIDWITGEKNLDVIENDLYNHTYKAMSAQGGNIYYKSPDGIKMEWIKKPKSALFELM